MPVPDDYLERVYAGVLGKLIGVYLGRPFEGWTHQRVLKELGHVKYYVNDHFDVPLVVTDDDVSGTFTFPRALEEHGVRPDITPEEVGKTWLNNVIEYRTIFWWGGNGISTEHTAYLNLRKGIKAPDSGSIRTNGKTVAEQIGAQIFIDGWAMISPGNPGQAARFAEAAGKVSHDGESVYAAMVLAVMEAEAFVSKDVDHLLDTGLSFIPKDCLVAKSIGDIRSWARTDKDWMKTRQRIEDKYGYEKFHGICHVIPNHGIMAMALLYGGHSFHEAMHIINTCGWDTDCNSGNIGCLVALMHGMKAFEGGPDWRGPIADRALISSADAGYSVNNAARITYNLVNLGRQLADQKPLQSPKEGAQFHFTLPGSVQGFKALNSLLTPDLINTEQGVDSDGGSTGLAIKLQGLTKANGLVGVLTPTFTPPSIRKMKTYDLMASPLLYPGQTIKALLRASQDSTTSIQVRIRFNVYGKDDEFVTIDSNTFTELVPGAEQVLQYTIEDNMDHQPIQQVGVSLLVPFGHFTGTVWLDYLRWDGSPQLTLRRPRNGPCDFWRQAWVNGVSKFHQWGPSFFLAQDAGEGIISYGTREWKDYRMSVSDFRVNLGGPAGVAVRVQGLRRYYAFLFNAGNRVAIVKALDEEREELASAEFDWQLDVTYQVGVIVKGNCIRAQIHGKDILDAKDSRFGEGGIGFIVTDGSIAAEEVQVDPAA
jgi:ADP-ribosylglycohydrolase